MDLEDLTKHQIILLMFLVSLVTSVATGIVVVSVMDKAPASVTRTINQIVERTVETVTPSPTQTIKETEKTVVVNNDDVIAQSIAALQKSVIRITLKGGDALLARGIIVDAKGTALTDSAALAGGSSFDAILPNGSRVSAMLRAQDGTSSPIAVLDVAVGTSTGFAAAPLADTSKLQLGQSVIRIGGRGQDSVGEGVVAMLPSGSEGDTPNAVEATVSSGTLGSVLATMFGEVIGLSTSQLLSENSEAYSLATQPQAAAPKKSSAK